MSSYNFDLGAPINSFDDNGSFEKRAMAFNAYKAVISKVEVFEKTYEDGGKAKKLNIFISTTDVKNGEYDKIVLNMLSDKFIKNLGLVSNKLVKSNPKLQGAEEKSVLSDIDKNWVGLEIGVVYLPQSEKINSEWIRTGRYGEPAWAISTKEVETWKLSDDLKDLKDAWEKRWSLGNYKNQHQSSEGAAPQKQQQAPADDDSSDSLPF